MICTVLFFETWIFLSNLPGAGPVSKRFPFVSYPSVIPFEPLFFISLPLSPYKAKDLIRYEKERASRRSEYVLFFQKPPAYKRSSFASLAPWGTIRRSSLVIMPIVITRIRYTTTAMPTASMVHRLSFM